MQISLAQDADVEPVVDLWREVDLLRPRNDPHHDLELARQDPAAAVLVGRLEDVVVASVLVGFDGHRGWVYYLAVSPRLQGEGLGRRMMQGSTGLAHAGRRTEGAADGALLQRRRDRLLHGDGLRAAGRRRAWQVAPLSSHPPLRPS